MLKYKKLYKGVAIMANKTFHALFPDAGEPKMPIKMYNRLLDKFDEDTAFEFLCNYEQGIATDEDIEAQLNSVEVW